MRTMIIILRPGNGQPPERDVKSIIANGEPVFNFKPNTNSISHVHILCFPLWGTLI